MGEEPRDGFAEVIGSAEELREHYRRPARFVVDKLMDRLDDNFRAYIGSLPPDRAPRCHGRLTGRHLPSRGRCPVATRKQVQAAERNVKKAQSGARQKRSIANLPAKTRAALGKQGAAVAKRKRTGSSSPKTRQELYDEARRGGLPGRSKMGRDELVRALGHQ